MISVNGLRSTTDDPLGRYLRDRPPPGQLLRVERDAVLRVRQVSHGPTMKICTDEELSGSRCAHQVAEVTMVA